MNALTASRISILLAAFAVASATAPTVRAQSAAEPTMKLGDRWVYNVKSGIGLTTFTYQETREVTAVGADGFKITVNGKTPDGADFSAVQDFAAPFNLRSGTLCLNQPRRYPTPLQRVPFPLAPGQRSAKWVDVVSDPGGTKGQINYSFRTRGWDKLTTPAGAFDAIRIDVLITLDDSTPFRNATTCNFTYWYSPAVRGTVRERRSAQYRETSASSRMPIPVLNASYELASFTPGKP